jgi:hypothetical protein
VVTTPAGTSYVVPLADFDYQPEIAAWDDGFYDPALIAELVGQVIPTSDGGLLTEGGVLADGGLAADGGFLPTTSKFPRPIGSLLALWGVVVNSSCAPTVASVDDDQDGIPAAYSATFSCSNIVAGDLTSSVTGAVTIADADDHSTTAGLTVTYSNFVASVVRKNGINRSRTLNGTVSIAPTGSGSFQITKNLTTNFAFADSGGDPAQGTWISTAQATYAPQAGVSDPFSQGTVTFSGQGTLSRNFGGANLSRVVTRTTNPPLHWNRSCRTQTAGNIGFDSGSLIYTDDAGSSVTLKFSGCGGPPSVTTKN